MGNKQAEKFWRWFAHGLISKYPDVQRVYINPTKGVIAATDEGEMKFYRLCA